MEKSKTAKKAPNLKRMKLDDALARLNSARPNMLPSFMKDGRIRAGIGAYQLATDKSGKEVLLFALSPYDLHEFKTKPNNFAPKKDDAKDGDDEKDIEAKRIYVVGAKEASSQDWILPTILDHQQKLSSKFMKSTTLYQTDDFTWKSGPLAYRLFFNKDKRKNDDGETLYRLRLYSEISDEDSFTNVEDSAPNGFVNNAFSLGTDQGAFTRAEAEKLIATDFTHRILRMRAGEDPMSSAEKDNYIAWGAVRGWQGISYYWKNTSISHKFLHIGKKIVDVIEGPFAIGRWLVEKVAEKALSDSDKKAIIEQKYGGYADISETNPTEKSLMVPLDIKKAKKLTLIDDDHGDARPDNVHALEKATNDWAEEWILQGLYGPSGSLVRFHKNDATITIERSNGIVLDVNTETNTAYAQFVPELAQKGARKLPQSVQKLLKGGEVLRLKIESGDIKGDFITAIEHRIHWDKETEGGYRYRTPSGKHPVSNRRKRRKAIIAKPTKAKSKAKTPAINSKNTPSPKPKSPNQ